MFSKNISRIILDEFINLSMHYVPVTKAIKIFTKQKRNAKLGMMVDPYNPSTL